MVGKIDLQIGKRVAERRQALGITSEALAQSIGVTLPELSDFEKGRKRIGAGILQLLVQALEVPLEYFFGNDLPEPPKASSNGKSISAYLLFGSAIYTYVVMHLTGFC